MIICHDKDGIRLHAVDGEEIELRKLSRARNLFCPSCTSNVFYRSGKVTRPHFYHEKDAECLHTFYENETKEHHLGKTLLYDHFNSNKLDNIRICKLEHWIEETRQKPDIYIELINGKKIAIEYQCSPISISQKEERTRRYHSLGVEVCWVFGFEQFITKTRRFKIRKDGVICRYQDKKVEYFGSDTLHKFNATKSLVYKMNRTNNKHEHNMTKIHLRDLDLDGMKFSTDTSKDQLSYKYRTSNGVKAGALTYLEPYFKNRINEHIRTFEEDGMLWHVIYDKDMKETGRVSQRISPSKRV